MTMIYICMRCCWFQYLLGAPQYKDKGSAWVYLKIPAKSIHVIGVEDCEVVRRDNVFAAIC